MSQNTTLPLAFPSPQPNSTSTDVIVNIVFGIAGTAVSAFAIYHGHRMWKLWRLNNRSHDEEHELESVPDTASGGYNNTPPTRGSLAPSEPSTADNTPPTRGSLEPSELSAGDTTGVNMDDTEPAVGEDKDVQL